jgi:hypothetical protein
MQLVIDNHKSRASGQPAVATDLSTAPYAMRRVHYTLLAFLMAPTLSALGLALLLGPPQEGVLQRLVVFPFFYFFTVIATLLIGLPAYLLLSRLDLVKWWSASASGAFAGFAGVLTMLWLGGAADTPAAFPEIAPVGALGGLAFWMVWRIGRS